MDLTTRLDPRAAVVVVIDVQNDFCHGAGLQASQGKDVSHLDPVVDRIEVLLKHARSVEVPVLFVRTTHSAGTDTPEWLARHADPRREQSCQSDTWGSEFYRLAPEAGDRVVVKHRYSAFTRTLLEETLSSLGRRSLLFCGVTSNTCVETTLRDAVCRDYLVTMVDDCCGAYSREAHERTVQSVSAGFGAVADSTTIVAAWTPAVSTLPVGRS